MRIVLILQSETLLTALFDDVVSAAEQGTLLTNTAVDVMSIVVGNSKHIVVHCYRYVMGTLYLILNICKRFRLHMEYLIDVDTSYMYILLLRLLGIDNFRS